ncbi:hypothetical protein PENTCL1PPCAC_8274 [Pristionchus entomophagus]|uniref:Anoctamin n=1 Tax=Pristionchus entomophagus TaxID=358040 RepID=A0AAV5SXK8_9BILA|nr:hypothetical protein PENTCL1PPCAC_8274 [Pristionchus entomophagus]
MTTSCGRRDSWRSAMRQSESGRPLLMNGSRPIDEDDFETLELRAMDDPMNKTLEFLDRSMYITVKLDFDNSCLVGDTQIDYVLAYEEEDDAPGPNGEVTDAQKRASRRKYFEKNLTDLGLKLTEVATDPTGDQINPNPTKIKPKWRPRTKVEGHTDCLQSLHKWIAKRTSGLQLVGRTHYILVHAPFAVLERQAQLLNVKLPVKKCDVESSGRTLMPGCLDRCLDKMRFLDFDDDLKEQLEEPDYYSASYSTDNRKKFVLWDQKDLMFPSSERSRLVYDLLVRARYRPMDSEEDKYRVGIERLIGNGTYTGAYPLHQELRSRAELESTEFPTGKNQRELLYTCWASWRCLYKYQPLDLIKRYFGSKIGLYFAWLGYYTKTLYPAAFLGLICFLYGVTHFGRDTVSMAVCQDNSTYQCPVCSSFCDFTPLRDSCGKAKLTYVFDNALTVVFAALMSVWASLFLEGWKRYHAEVAWKWGLFDFAVEEDLVRPEFQYRVKTTKWNPVTKKHEPYLSSKKKCFNFVASGVTVVFFIFLVLGVVFGVVVYRSIVMGLLQRANFSNDAAFYTVTITAAILNLIVILIMNYVYYFLALILTRWECPRTQNDFDNSFTIKVFLFQFVNYYSSLFYVAFFKGLLAQLPTFSYTNEGVKLSGGALKIRETQLDGCDAVGCFDELVIQLAIIMCGRQFFSGFVELGYPFIMKLFRQWQFLVPASKRERNAKEDKLGEIGAKRWEEDYFLAPTYEQWLFDEYLEMVIQFGFITLFVAAFPLAPLFALVNNIMEIRMDAYKFLVSTQRPVPAQSRNIGIWLQILQFISNISVTINALVIAFTSDFVPRTYYKYLNKNNLTGYLEWSLSHFDSSQMRPNESNYTGMIDCVFRGFRKMPCSMRDHQSTQYFTPIDPNSDLYKHCDESNSYQFSEDFWKVFALRLVFVVVFEHVVFLVKTIVDYLIPDVPTKIFVQQQREKYLSRKAAAAEIISRQGSIKEGQRRTATSSDVNEVAFQPGEFGQPYSSRSGPPSEGSFETAPSEVVEEQSEC